MWCATRTDDYRRGRLQACKHLRRNRLRLNARRIAGIADGPDPGLEAFDRQRARLGEPVLDLEARPAALDERGLDRDIVAEPVVGRRKRARVSTTGWPTKS